MMTDGGIPLSTGPNPWRDTLVFAAHAILKLRRNPEQVFDVVVTAVMFTVLFTYLFGGALAGSPEPYLRFLPPGILVDTVMFTSIYTGFTLNQDITKGVFDRFRAIPIRRPAPLAGAILGGVVRYKASALLVFIVGFAMGYRAEGGVAVLVSLALLNLFALGIGWIFTAVALTFRSAGTVMTLSWLAPMPVTFGSTIHLEAETMPGWLLVLVGVNPVSHIAEALRGVLGGAPSTGAIALGLAAPLGVTAAFAPLSLWLYGRERV